MDQCESCAYYEFDDEMGQYVCVMNLDEDEMQRFLSQKTQNCGYYKYYDEYAIARKQ